MTEDDSLLKHLLTVGGIVVVCIGVLATCTKYNDGYYTTAQECVKQGMEWQAGGPFGSTCYKDTKDKRKYPL